MVSVNGDMIGPLGGAPQSGSGGGSGSGHHYGDVFPGDPSISIDKGKWIVPYVCEVVVYQHVRFVFAQGYDADKKKATIERFRWAFRDIWNEKHLDCPVPPGGMGCTIHFSLIIHDEWDRPKGDDGKFINPLPINVPPVDFPGDPVPWGLTYAGKSITFYNTGNIASPGGGQYIGLTNVAAHEIGHNWFPQGHRPDNWDGQGHDPDPGSVMSGTHPPGSNVSQEMLKKLNDRFSLCDMVACCNKPAVTPRNVRKE